MDIRTKIVWFFAHQYCNNGLSMVNLAETLLDWSIYLKCTHLWHPIDGQSFLSANYENWNIHDYKLFIKKKRIDE